LLISLSAIKGQQINQRFALFCKFATSPPNLELELQFLERTKQYDCKIDQEVKRNNHDAEETHPITCNRVWYERREAYHVVKHKHNYDLVDEFYSSSLCCEQCFNAADQDHAKNDGHRFYKDLADQNISEDDNDHG